MKNPYIMNKLIALLFVSAPFHTTWAQSAPSLGAAQSFAILGATTVTNAGPTVVTGDLGVNPGSAVTGFPPGLVIGATHAADALALQAQNDTTTAYVNLAGQSCNTTFGVPTDIGGMTLVPGVYCFASSAQLTGVLTLNGGGDPNAVWIFKIASTLTTASSSSVLLIDAAQNCNVFWQVGSSAVIGTSTSFIGNILALTSISLTTNANLSGRALARNGAVTMDSNTVAISMCAPPPTEQTPPTLSKDFSPSTVNAGGTSTLTITLNNPSSTIASLTAPLTDYLPSGVMVVEHEDISCNTTCGGTITHNTEMSTVVLTGGSIPANGSCTVTVHVTAPSAGNYTNSIAAGALQTSNGSNTSPALTTLTVTSVADIAPKLKKVFNPATINAGEVSTLTITLKNPNNTVANLTAALTDYLPSGMLVSHTDNSCSCATTCNGTITPHTHDSDLSTVILTGGTIPANGSCTVTVPVTVLSAGSYINSLIAGALQTSVGNNATEASATLTVLSATGAVPTLSKAFSPSTIAACKVSTLTITLSNPNSTVANLTAPLTDYLPSGVVVAKNNLFTTTCGGTVAASTGSSKVILTGGSIPANGSCTVTVNVTAPSDGSYINSLAADALKTSNGNNVAPATATLTVITN